MNLPVTLRERLVQEFEFATEKMKGEKDAFRKLYFFSALFGEAGRLLNWIWDPELSLIHAILQQTYNQINARMGTIVSGGDKGIGIPNILFDDLTQTAIALTEYIKSKKDDKTRLCELLERFSEIAYVTTGNGFYLYEKGMIKLSSQTESAT